MTKYLPFILVFLIVICGGSFAQAYEPPSCFLFHDDAQYRLDSLQLQLSDSNFLEQIVLMSNLAFHKNNKLRKQAVNILKKHFKKDTTTLVVVYRNSLKLLEIRDRGKAGNGFKMFGSFFGASKDPRKEGRKAYDNIRLALQNDLTNIRLRLVILGITIESSEPLDGLLTDAYNDLQWLKDRADKLDSAEAFFYNLSWAKYAYKYAIIKGRKFEASKGLAWLILAEQYAVIEDYHNEIRIWRSKIDSLQKK